MWHPNPSPAPAALMVAWLAAATGCGEAPSTGQAAAAEDIPVGIVLTPEETVLDTGMIQRYSAYGRLGNGDSVAVAVSYAATGGTITADGRYAAGPAPGVFQVVATGTEIDRADTAAVEIHAAPPLPGTANPNFLPLARPNQVPAFEAYDALDVPGQSAGFSYADPVTGVTIFKVSDARFATPDGPSLRVVPDYSEFGPHISMPWVDRATGDTLYTLHVVSDPGGWAYFVEFNYTTGAVSNWREARWGLLQGGFSSNPATPQIGYRIGGDNRIHRVNTATGQDRDLGGFPSPVLPNLVSGTQFSAGANDEWFSVQGGLSQAPNDHGVTWNAATDEVQDWGANNIDEYRLGRAGKWLYPQRDSDSWFQGSLADGPPSAGIDTWISPFWMSHAAAVEDYLVGYDPSGRRGRRLLYYDPATHTRTWIGAIGQIAADHPAGQWVNGNLSGTRQWFLVSAYNGDASALLHEGIGFIQLNDADAANVRLLAHHYSAADKNNYWSQPHATISPDGKVVMWGSEMHVPGGRIDTFVARVPTH